MKQVVLTLEAEKKHSVRYDYAGPEIGPLATSMYVNKSHLSRPFPKKIKVTVEEVEG